MGFGSYKFRRKASRGKWLVCLKVHLLLIIYRRQNFLPYPCGIHFIFLLLYDFSLSVHWVKSVRIRSYSGQHFPAFWLQENADQDNLKNGYVLCSGYQSNISIFSIFHFSDFNWPVTVSYFWPIVLFITNFSSCACFIK